MLMNKTKMAGAEYTRPEQLSKNIQKQVREKKEADTEIHNKIKAEVRNEFPAGTDEAINAMVVKKIYNLEQAEHVLSDPELTLRPDVKKTIRRETITERYHNGKYELDRFSEKGKSAWSCCMNKREDSEGCVVRKVDKHKWNLSGF
uniref:Uncharacterized protein n=1 Tax=Favella ehrenbergii TaxID=182087 RepID=A0A7S3HX71_9SPIT|mmetsp:Transcript_16056/g.20337  ORF Transcript_16056/g.20337 Transcript_16056/m.20337 type:complete len:146 (+) Transcript_16056:603-1040(+)